MPMNEDDKRRVKMHIALNEFYKAHKNGDVIDLGECYCGKWIVGEPVCACGNKLVHLDFSETIGKIFPAAL